MEFWGKKRFLVSASVWLRGPIAVSCLLMSSQASAQSQTANSAAQPHITIFGLPFRALEITQSALLVGAMVAALASALWLIRERGRIAEQNNALRTKLASKTVRLNHLETLTGAEGQQAIIWSSEDEKPVIVGSLEKNTGAPSSREQLLAFGRWLDPKSAAYLDNSLGDLRDNAEPFHHVLKTLSGTPLEVRGRTSGGSAILQFADLSDERRRHALLAGEHEQAASLLKTLQDLLNNVEMPVWVRSENGNLTWVNTAFASSVDCADNAEVVDKQVELFGELALNSITEGCKNDGEFIAPLSTVVDGDRMVFDVLEIPTPAGGAGIAIDRTEREAIQSELSKTIHNHEETLDELTTAVAMFDDGKKLQFHNSAFAKLWNLDAPFLGQNPDIAIFLDRLRTDGQLPEQPEWRRWKDELLSVFTATEPQEHWWHLTDGRTIRVVANPHPKGGLTWVFENLTERIDLESRYKTMVQVQGETLDNLAEGVVVFGSDGRLNLANPAFNRFWAIEPDNDDTAVHISDIARLVAGSGGDASAWDDFAGIVTGFDEDRASDTGRLTIDERTLSWMVVPLPNGQTMITFVDITAADQIERALRDRNEALERTANLKNRFIQHVSYELRSPLTSIMGFTDLIAMQQIGALNEKQREYVGHIEQSSRALLETTDDILDLASVDAGVMELSFESVEIDKAMHQAAESLKERFEDHTISLAVRIAPDAGSIVADRARLIQVMENVLANAADFAPADSTVSFACERIEEGVVFKIRDYGPGIDQSVIENVFERFHTEGAGRRRGAGLGLAIVKSFVDLHDGEVTIESSPSRGTEVVMKFPQTPSHVSIAAE